MSDLPRDVSEEVLSRLPLTSLGGARFTCKLWNTLTKDESFFKKHLLEAAKKKQRKEVQVVMLLGFKVYLMSFGLLNPSPSIERIGKLVSLDYDGATAADGVDISNIFHCDGLLLCVTKDIINSRLVVWNPFSGETKWIQTRNSYHRSDRYAIGYENKDKNSLRSHKVLRFVDAYDRSVNRRVCEFEIYNLNSSSWKVIHVNPDWSIEVYQRGVSLKGNTYWFAHEKFPTQGPAISDLPDFLLCFDFTRERFGPRLPLPFHSFDDVVALSSVREEQLAVLFQQCGAPAYPLKIWISSKIEPNAVSWNKIFLDVEMKPLTGFKFLDDGGSFFLDEKEEVAVVLDKDRDTFYATRNIAYIIGKNGYFKEVDLGGPAKPGCWPLVCSYVPSSVQIKQLEASRGTHHNLY